MTIAGGGRPDIDTGWFVDATVFADVDNSMRIAQEEIFGPVLCVIPYESDDGGAVAIANDSDYGLAGSVWTDDAEHGLDIARRVRTGTLRRQPVPDGLQLALRRLQGVAGWAGSSAPRVWRPTSSSSRSPWPPVPDPVLVDHLGGPRVHAGRGCAAKNDQIVAVASSAFEGGSMPSSLAISG